MLYVAMSHSPHILVVEDDREIRTMVSRLLQKHGYRVTVTEDARTMERAFTASSIDLVILDVMLPGEDGLSVCRRLRARSVVPIIMLTAAGDTPARVVGLEMGADDYIAKPFDPSELVARTKAVLRRASALPSRWEQSTSAMYFAGWRIDPVARQLCDVSGATVRLTSAEFDLLLAFCRHPQIVLNRDQLLDLSQGRSGGPLDRGIDILVSRIRRKIEENPRLPELIKTVRTGGYIFTPIVVNE